MKGHLKSITLNTSQETWKLDLPAYPVPTAAGAQGQPQGRPPRVPITTSWIVPSHVTGTSAPVHNNKKRAASTSEPPQDGDDDDFMPPIKQHAGVSTSRHMSGTTSRRAPVQYAKIKVNHS
jgi:hypothetical protein